MRLTLFSTSIFSMLIALVTSPVQAAYPDKPITMYVAFSAGGTTDITARALAQGAEKILGVPIAIENKGGEVRRLLMVCWRQKNLMVITC